LAALNEEEIEASDERQTKGAAALTLAIAPEMAALHLSARISFVIVGRTIE